MSVSNFHLSLLSTFKGSTLLPAAAAQASSARPGLRNLKATNSRCNTHFNDLMIASADRIWAKWFFNLVNKIAAYLVKNGTLCAITLFIFPNTPYNNKLTLHTCDIWVISTHDIYGKQTIVTFMVQITTGSNSHGFRAFYTVMTSVAHNGYSKNSSTWSL